MRWVVLASAYVILWFLALQILLPIGIASRNDNAPAVLGAADPGAPQNPRVGLKILLATIAAGILWSVFYVLVLLKLVNV
jgi:predicted secreted protein